MEGWRLHTEKAPFTELPNRIHKSETGYMHVTAHEDWFLSSGVFFALLSFFLLL